MKRGKARKLREVIEQASASLPDETALEGVELFPAWEAGTDYEISVRVRYAGKLYRCEQSHTAQDGWEPPVTPALWTEVAKPGEIPEWKQPTGAQDAYNKGDQVRHADKIWTSDIDGNVWEPGVYGWSESVAR